MTLSITKFDSVVDDLQLVDRDGKNLGENIKHIRELKLKKRDFWLLRRRR